MIKILSVWGDKDQAIMLIRNAYLNHEDKESKLNFKYGSNGKVKEGILENKSLTEIDKFLEDVAKTTFRTKIKYPTESDANNSLFVSLTEEVR